jgi:hypothetical protein
VAAGAAALVLTAALAGCVGQPYRAGVEQRLLQLQGPAATFSIADQRYAIAAFPPPATMLLVRAGPVYLWATPTPTLHDLYLQDVVGDRWVDSHVLLVGSAGTVDCSYAFRWDR